MTWRRDVSTRAAHRHAISDACAMELSIGSARLVLSSSSYGPCCATVSSRQEGAFKLAGQAPIWTWASPIAPP